MARPNIDIDDDARREGDTVVEAGSRAASRSCGKNGRYSPILAARTRTATGGPTRTTGPVTQWTPSCSPAPRARVAETHRHDPERTGGDRRSRGIPRPDRGLEATRGQTRRSAGILTVSRPVSGGVTRGLSTGGRSSRKWPLTCGFAGRRVTGADRWKPWFRGLPRPGRGPGAPPLSPSCVAAMPRSWTGSGRRVGPPSGPPRRAVAGAWR